MATFTVAAGHGGASLGAQYHGRSEAVLMSWLRDVTANKLRDMGHAVRTDGSGVMNWPLVRAITLIQGADTAIELHTNASTSAIATGVEVYSLPKHKGKAQAIAKAIADTLGLPLRGDGGWKDQKESQHGTLGFVRLGGILVEVFFISNVHDLAEYEGKKWLVASAIANTLADTAQA